MIKIKNLSGHNILLIMTCILWIIFMYNLIIHDTLI